MRYNSELRGRIHYLPGSGLKDVRIALLDTRRHRHYMKWDWQAFRTMYVSMSKRHCDDGIGDEWLSSCGSGWVQSCYFWTPFACPSYLGQVWVLNRFACRRISFQFRKGEIIFRLITHRHWILRVITERKRFEACFQDKWLKIRVGYNSHTVTMLEERLTDQDNWFDLTFDVLWVSNTKDSEHWLKNSHPCIQQA